MTEGLAAAAAFGGVQAKKEGRRHHNVVFRAPTGKKKNYPISHASLQQVSRQFLVTY